MALSNGACFAHHTAIACYMRCCAGWRVGVRGRQTRRQDASVSQLWRRSSQEGTSHTHTHTHTYTRIPIHTHTLVVYIHERLPRRMALCGVHVCLQEGCICTPDVTAFAVTGRDRFLLLACDGFWTVS